MKANAPEKIYFDGESLAYKLPIFSSQNIEYTRTDAFIENAAQWLKENLLNHTYVYEGEVGIGMAVFLEDFKNYIKGE
jgi:hypothetical protein